jgi:hypothetical protein
MRRMAQAMQKDQELALLAALKAKYEGERT